MKIYVSEYNINKLSKKISLLQNYYFNTKKNMYIYSDDGIFKIGENNIKKYKITGEKIERVEIEGVKLIVDESKIEYEICNFIPYDHFLYKNTHLVYKIHQTSKLFLIIEGNYSKNMNTFFVPTDFYFETDIEEKIYNPIIKDDLNVFLSLLN
jgi:hypothetical protein